jgi:hypothetical protein
LIRLEDLERKHRINADPSARPDISDSSEPVRRAHPSGMKTYEVYIGEREGVDGDAADGETKAGWNGVNLWKLFTGKS